MKFVALASLASVASAGFPSFDSFHAHCQLTTTFSDSCSNVYAALDNTSKTFTDPAGGLYAVKQEVPNSSVWVTRTTPVKHYVDDILFSVSGSGSSCTVVGKSRSQSMSYYDYDTNFCNIYNVFT